MVQTIASRRCKCGTRVTIKAETDRTNPTVSKIPAACPDCGDQQDVYAHRIVAVTGEKEEQSSEPA